MTLLDIDQGSEEWRIARCGSLGASRIHEAVAKIKSGWGASRDNVMADLILERLVGRPAENFVTRDMQIGIEREPEARAAYSFYFNAEVAQIGLARHPRISGTHASPDGLIGDDGLLELKCCKSSTHLAALLGEKIPERYVLQALWQLSCLDRAWVDVGYYNPDFPEEMRLFVRRVTRDDARIIELETQVTEFLTELEDKLQKLRATVGMKEAA